MKKKNFHAVHFLLLPTFLLSLRNAPAQDKDEAQVETSLSGQVVLNEALNGRVNETDKIDFSKNAGNVVDVLPRGTVGYVMKVTKMPSGNLGVKLRIASRLEKIYGFTIILKILF